MIVKEIMDRLFRILYRYVFICPDFLLAEIGNKERSHVYQTEKNIVYIYTNSENINIKISKWIQQLRRWINVDNDISFNGQSEEGKAEAKQTCGSIIDVKCAFVLSSDSIWSKMHSCVESDFLYEFFQFIPISSVSLRQCVCVILSWPTKILLEIDDLSPRKEKWMIKYTDVEFERGLCQNNKINNWLCCFSLVSKKNIRSAVN